MDRAYIHIEQRRFDRAIPEIKLHLAEEPEDAYAISMLVVIAKKEAGIIRHVKLIKIG